MSDDRSITINLHESVPLVQSSNSLNSSNGSNNHNLMATPGSGNGSSAVTPNSSGNITIQTSLQGSNSFMVGTKSNQAFISDAPVTDPGGSTAKQVNSLWRKRSFDSWLLLCYELNLFSWIECLKYCLWFPVSIRRTDAFDNRKYGRVQQRTA